MLRSIYIACVVCMCLSAHAQVVIDTTNPIQFGVYGHVGKNWQVTGGFSQLGSFAKPDAAFGNGSGEMVMFGGEVNSPLSSIFKATNTTASFHVGLRFGFDVFNSTMQASEQTTFIQNGQPIQGTFQYGLKVHFASYGVEPMIEYTPPFYKQLRIHVGAKVAHVYSANFTQSESIVSPGGVEYIQGVQERTVYENQIPDYSSYQFYALAGLSYNIRLNKRFALVPEVFYQKPLNHLTTAQNWEARFFRAGLSLRVTIPTTKPVIRDTIYQRDTLTHVAPDVVAEKTERLNLEYRTVVNENEQVRYEFVHVNEKYQHSMPQVKVLELAQLQLRIYRYKADSTIVPMDSLRCREIIWNDFHPLLNYVFFRSGSAQLEGRYALLRQQDTKNFTVRADQPQIETYYNMMNILAKGLREDASSKLDIVGCVSKKELAELPDAANLAQARAYAVASYLHDTWNIDESRMNVRATLAPQKPSSEKSDEGVEENQRVEIYSQREELLQPVMLRDTMLESTVERLRIANLVRSDSPILSWKLWGEQEGKVIFTQNGEGKPEEYFDISLERSTMRRLMRKEHSIVKINMEIDQEGKGLVQKSVSIPIVVEQIEKLKRQNLITEVDRFILMLFDFGKDDITASNERIIQFIKKRIDTAAAVTITGTTDRYGSLMYNLKLSERRALGVYKILGIPSAQTYGLGPDTITYDNDTPEGRFHARTVRIEVEHRKAYSSRLDRQLDQQLNQQLDR